MLLELKQLLEEQKALDQVIMHEHHLTRQETWKKRIVAFLVELSELANETKSFKFWSLKQPSPKAVILEEYVDGIHFLVSLGIDLGEEADCIISDELDETDINLVFIELFQLASMLVNEFTYEQYRALFALYLHLGELLDFSGDEVVAAYMKKNEINHQRQATNY